MPPFWPIQYVYQGVVPDKLQKLPGLLVPHCVALPVDVREVKVSHEHQGLWFRDFFELWRRLHLISPCLSGGSVMYSQHHVILTGDSSDPDLQTV